MFCTRRKQLAKLHGHKTAGRRSDHLLSFFLGGCYYMLLLLYMIFLGVGWLNHQLTTKFAFSDVPLGLCLKPFSVRDFPHVFSGILSPTPWRQLQWLTSLQGR